VRRKQRERQEPVYGPVEVSLPVAVRMTYHDAVFAQAGEEWKGKLLPVMNDPPWRIVNSDVNKDAAILILTERRL
jgi:hypothetical protein